MQISALFKGVAFRKPRIFVILITNYTVGTQKR